VTRTRATGIQNTEDGAFDGRDTSGGIAGTTVQSGFKAGHDSARQLPSSPSASRASRKNSRSNRFARAGESARTYLFPTASNTAGQGEFPPRMENAQQRSHEGSPVRHRRGGHSDTPPSRGPRGRRREKIDPQPRANEPRPRTSATRRAAR